VTVRQPYGIYAALLVLGAAPTPVVLQYYNVLSNRTVIQWDMFGNTTIIGTRPATVLTIAYVAAAIAVTAVLVAVLQHRALVELGLRRAYLMLNFAQIVAIDLTCAMIVTDALGLRLTLKPTIPPAMAVLLMAGAVLCWRLGQGAVRVAAALLAIAAFGILALGAIAANAVVGYYASALALLAMAAVALPDRVR
jgi:hypothetical protein